MKILLLQARTADDPAKSEELASFADKAGLPLSAFISHDLLTGPPRLEELSRFAALMIGGSGDFSVASGNLPLLDETLTFLAETIARKFPIFASCFGFQAIVRALAGKKPPPPATVSKEVPKVDTPAAVADGPSNELKLTDVEVEPTDSDNHFRFSFSVIHPGNEADQVVGTIWIAVNGLSNGKPVRLSLKQVSSETRPYLHMRFTGQQGVDGELTLPPDFEPKNIAIEAKPYDKKYRGASGKFDWTADG